MAKPSPMANIPSSAKHPTDPSSSSSTTTVYTSSKNTHSPTRKPTNKHSLTSQKNYQKSINTFCIFSVPTLNSRILFALLSIKYLSFMNTLITLCKEKSNREISKEKYLIKKKSGLCCARVLWEWARWYEWMVDLTQHYQLKISDSMSKVLWRYYLLKW